jgi:hypothetical protein
MFEVFAICGNALVAGVVLIFSLAAINQVFYALEKWLDDRK